MSVNDMSKTEISVKNARRGIPAVVSLALALAAVTGLGAGAADPGPSIENGYSTALSAVHSGPAQSPAEGTVAGSEAFWLGQPYKGDAPAGKVEAASWKAPVAKGELITVGDARHQRKLEVIAVDPILETATRIDTTAGVRGVVVIARDPADPDGRLEHITIRGPASLSDTARAL